MNLRWGRLHLLDACGQDNRRKQSAGQHPNSRTQEVAASRHCRRRRRPCSRRMPLLRRLIVNTQQVAHQVRLWLRLQRGDALSKVSIQCLLM